MQLRKKNTDELLSWKKTPKPYRSNRYDNELPTPTIFPLPLPPLPTHPPQPQPQSLILKKKAHISFH